MGDVRDMQLDGRKMTFAVVRIRSGLGSVTNVRDVKMASDTMLAWPGRGTKWRTAAEVLSEALYGRASAEDARRVFVAAAKEAGVLMGES